MRASLYAVLIALLLFMPVSAKADDIVTISFDELNVGEDVVEFYNGGLGSQGTGPVASLGISFSSGWIAGPPNVYPYQPNGNSVEISGIAIMNVHAGWSDSISFYYYGGDLLIGFYEQENGLGDPVATWDLPGQPDFFPAGGELPLFRSAVFNSSSGNRIDALTKGAYVVPEPTSLVLLLTGFGAFMWFVALEAKRRLP
jgi:hypothetical protein